MEKVIYIADASKDYSNLIALLVVLAALLLFLYLVETKKIKQLEAGAMRQISLLLGGLMTLILFATTLFTSWNLLTIQPVKLYETYIETYHGKTPYTAIKKVGIFNDKGTSMVNSQIVIREDNILAIEKKNRKVMLFADENYDLIPLVEKIKEQIAKHKKPQTAG